MKKNNMSTKKKKFLIFLLLAFFFSSFAFIIFDSQITPIIYKMTESYCKNFINEAINKEINQLMGRGKISSKDFYTITYDSTNKEIKSLELNTLLINSICTNISTNVSKELNNNTKKKEILIPFTSILEIPYIFGYGPNISVEIFPTGNVNVDYSSSFVTAGINQSSLEIWIEVTAYIEVINPILQKDIQINRRVPIVATIINGTVPDGILYK